jgi:cyclophilin family peptidyl-prolyl cis-trans isomerase
MRIHQAFSFFLAAGLALAPLAGSASTARGGIALAIVTDRGSIDVVLDPVHAPVTTKNFLHYVDAGFYGGGTFFRAVPGFVIQGGNKDRERPSDRPIPLEAPSKTGLKNVDGALAMARTPEPDSATSEFFICDGNQPNLDGTGPGTGYAVFGHVTGNMALVRAIAASPAVDQALTTPVKIIRITRIR